MEVPSTLYTSGNERERGHMYVFFFLRTFLYVCLYMRPLESSKTPSTTEHHSGSMAMPYFAFATSPERCLSTALLSAGRWLTPWPSLEQYRIITAEVNSVSNYSFDLLISSGAFMQGLGGRSNCTRILQINLKQLKEGEEKAM